MRIYLLTLLISVSSALGATYTVCPSGCDYTTFSALFAAVDLEAGDIVEARASSPGGSVTIYEEINPGANDAGSSGNPLIIRARPGDSVTINGGGTNGHGFRMLNAANDFVMVDGFTFTGYTNYGARIAGTIGDDIDGFTLTNCTFLTVSNHPGTGSYPSLMCFYPRYVTDILITSNRFLTEDKSWKCQTDGIQIGESTDAIVEFNDFHMRNGDGGGHNDCLQFNTSLRPDVGTQHIRFNRFVQDNAATSLTQLVYHEYATNGTVYIHHNLLVVSNTSSGSYALTVTPKTTSTLQVVATNNTMWVNGNNAGYRFDAHVRNPVFAKNIFYNNSGAADQTGFYLESTNVTPSLISLNLYFTHSATVNNFLRDKAGFRTWSAWQGAGYDVGGWNETPGFANTNGTDLRLTSSDFNGGDIGALPFGGEGPVGSSVQAIISPGGPKKR